MDQDFFSDMFHFLKSNELFCDSYFFAVPHVIKSALCEALSEEKKNLWLVG